MVYYLVAICIINTVLSSVADEQCDLNEETCFEDADKRYWKFNYVYSKQEYIEQISQGKSPITTRYIKKHALTRRDSVKVGHVEKVKFHDGRTVDVITKALVPPVFEIPDFLTAEECDHFIRRAEDDTDAEMFVSVAKGGLSPIDTWKPTGRRGKAMGKFGVFKLWDGNKDDYITVQEMIVFIHWEVDIIMLEKDVHEMFAKLEMTALLEDGFIDMQEFDMMDSHGIAEYAYVLSKVHPRFKSRHSNQTWLDMESWVDEVVPTIRERLITLSGLGREIVYGGEGLQVIHYGLFGHYHAHEDSETHNRTDIPCFHQQREDMTKTVNKCKLCRYLTLLMYLNDVEEGGETAFVVADAINADETITRGNSSNDKYNLSHRCKLANLIVKPKKGTAIMWYNHHVNITDGWLGELDLFSAHGGCDVIKGEKWIINMWIPAPYGKDAETPSVYLDWYDLYLAEEEGRKRTLKKMLET